MRSVLVLWVIAACAGLGRAQPEVLVRFSPEAAQAPVGAEVTVEVVADVGDMAELVAFGFDLCFDPAILAHDAAVQVDVGMAFVPIASADGDGLAGVVIPTEMPVSGETAVLAAVTFTTIGEGVSPLDVLVTPGDLLEGFVGNGGVELSTEFEPGQVTVGPAGPTALWHNGPDDEQDGVASTVNAHVASRVADDCWLKEGMFYDVERVYVRMAIADGFTPDTELTLYADCDGLPDSSTARVVPQLEYEFVRAGTGPLAGTDVYEIAYDVSELVESEDIRWVSPVHLGEGTGYWVTANGGKIQGRQAHVDAAVFGLPAWSPIETELCCGQCSDMYFRVEGKCCWRVLAQSDFESVGLTDAVLSQNVPWARSFDDFQLADPCQAHGSWDVCRVEAIFATNCDVSTIYAEIYANDCDTPRYPDDPLYRLEPTAVEDLSAKIAGLPVYKVTFRCPEGVTLADGCNYWLTIFSEQGSFVGKRSVWAFRQRPACELRLNEAAYVNPTIGFESPTPVSDAALHGAPRDFAFSVWVRGRD